MENGTLTMTQVTTEYSSYDDDSIESMVHYCMLLRGTTSVVSTMLEFGWFMESVCYGALMSDVSKEIQRTYTPELEWDEFIPVTSYMRLFVKYCENEYGD